MTIRCARTVALIKHTLLGLTSVEGGLVHLEHVWDNENASRDTGHVRTVIHVIMAFDSPCGITLHFHSTLVWHVTGATL